MGRWYDQDRSFAGYIEKLRDAEEATRDGWVKEILAIMKKSEPESFNTEKLVEFPLKMFRRRWYDSDPYLWLLMNSMQNMNEDTLKEIREYLAKV